MPKTIGKRCACFELKALRTGAEHGFAEAALRFTHDWRTCVRTPHQGQWGLPVFPRAERAKRFIGWTLIATSAIVVLYDLDNVSLASAALSAGLFLGGSWLLNDPSK